MRLLTCQKPHNLAADLPAGARHRDTHHASQRASGSSNWMGT
jgi:hypothetical protein